MFTQWVLSIWYSQGKCQEGTFRIAKGQSPPTTGACVVTVAGQRAIVLLPQNEHTLGQLPCQELGKDTRRILAVYCFLSVCLFKAVIVLWDPFLSHIFFPNRCNWEWNQVYLIPSAPWVMPFPLCSWLLREFWQWPSLPLYQYCCPCVKSHIRQIQEEGPLGTFVLPCNGCCQSLQ